MNNLRDMTESLREWLQQDQACVGYHVVSAYPDETVQNPVQRGTVAVGVGELKLEPAVLDGSVGVAPQGVRLAREAEWTLQLALYAPRHMGGQGCFDMLSAVASALLERQDRWQVGAIRCGQTRYDRDTRTFVLTGTVRVSTLLEIER